MKKIPLSSAHVHENSATGSVLAWAQTVTMAGMAGLFIWLLITGNISNYINTRFIGYTYIGAAALTAIALYSLLTSLGRVQAGHSGHVTWAAAGLVALPLMFGVIAPSKPLGADALTAELDAGAISSIDSSNLAGGDSRDWNLLDWLRAFHVSDNPDSLEGLPVDAVGFLRFSDEGPDSSFTLARFLVNCCVADTVSVSLSVLDEGGLRPADLEAGDWSRVTGTVSVRDINGETQLVIIPDTITELNEAPSPSYIYP